MTNRLKHNIKVWVSYTLASYLILIPFHLGIKGISVALFLGFFFGFLNDILTQLRKLNGEKFPHLND